MKSIRDLYKVGRGPSSSHTIGPSRAVEYAKTRFPDAERFEVVLQGSLALTGKGHGTEFAIVEEFRPYDCSVIYDTATSDLPHPNTMLVSAFAEDGSVLGELTVQSIGGGDIVVDGELIGG